MPEAMQGRQSSPLIAPDAPQAPPSPAVGLERLSYQQLRAQLDELQSQRQTIANRRDALSRQYERATGANEQGIAARLTIMDKSIVAMESDIAAVAHELVVKAPGTTVPPFVGRHWQDSEVAGLGLSVFLGTMVLTLIVSRRLFGRVRWGRVPPVAAADSTPPNQRLDRIEQAVDAIAIEIERVSENQRFMTRLMTETQLAGTIAAVRSSAEAAKSASE